MTGSHKADSGRAGPESGLSGLGRLAGPNQRRLTQRPNRPRRHSAKPHTSIAVRPSRHSTTPTPRQQPGNAGPYPPPLHKADSGRTGPESGLSGLGRPAGPNQRRLTQRPTRPRRHSAKPHTSIAVRPSRHSTTPTPRQQPGNAGPYPPPLHKADSGRAGPESGLSGLGRPAGPNQRRLTQHPNRPRRHSAKPHTSIAVRPSRHSANPIPRQQPGNAGPNPHRPHKADSGRMGPESGLSGLGRPAGPNQRRLTQRPTRPSRHSANKLR